MLWIDGGTSYFFDDDWDGYVGTTGFDTSSPRPADPLFTDAPTDLTPLSSSPAVGAGEDVPWIATDYEGTSVGSPPDLGAIHHAAP